MEAERGWKRKCIPALFCFVGDAPGKRVRVVGLMMALHRYLADASGYAHNLRVVVAAVEGLAVDVGDGLRHVDVFEARAEFEGVSLNAFGGIGHVYFLYIREVIEGVLVDDFHALEVYGADGAWHEVGCGLYAFVDDAAVGTEARVGFVDVGLLKVGHIG